MHPLDHIQIFQPQENKNWCFQDCIKEAERMDHIRCYGGKKNSRNKTPLSAIYEVNQVRDIRKSFTHMHTCTHRCIHAHTETNSSHHSCESAKLRLVSNMDLFPTGFHVRHLGGNLASTCNSSTLSTLLLIPQGVADPRYNLVLSGKTYCDLVTENSGSGF